MIIGKKMEYHGILTMCYHVSARAGDRVTS